MKKVDVYNSDYTKLNHAYILIYESYQKLVDCEDADRDVLFVMESILRAFNPALDRIKSEMTVQTRFKDEPTGQKNQSEGKKETEKSENGEKTFIKAEKSGFVVGTIPVFTGDDEDDGGDGRETEKTTDSKKKGFFGSEGLFGKKKGE